MKQRISVLVYPVKDLPRAKTLYGKLLGVQPYADAPYYVGFRVGDQEIGLDPNGHKKAWTGQSRFGASTTSRKACSHSLTPAPVHEAAKDVGGGKLTATVKDADGNVIGLVQEP